MTNKKVGQKRAAALNAEILAAHRLAEPGRLAELYLEASQLKSDYKEDEASAFLLCQAYVFALEAASPLEAELHRRLKALGREE